MSLITYVYHNISKMDHQLNLEDNYRLDCDLWLDILHQYHKYLDMDFCTFDWSTLHSDHSLNLLCIRVYIKEVYQSSQKYMNRQQRRLFVYTDYLVHKEKVHMGWLLQLGLKLNNSMYRKVVYE